MPDRHSPVVRQRCASCGLAAPAVRPTAFGNAASQAPGARDRHHHACPPLRQVLECVRPCGAFSVAHSAIQRPFRQANGPSAKKSIRLSHSEAAPLQADSSASKPPSTSRSSPRGRPPDAPLAYRAHPQVRNAARVAPSPFGRGLGGSFKGRSPKAERSPSSEIRRPKAGAEGDSGFGLRVSAFGLRICPAAAQYVFGTCETEPQILAALDKNVRAPKHLRGAPGRTGGEMF